MVAPAFDRPAGSGVASRIVGSASRTVAGWLARAEWAQDGIALDLVLFAASTIFAAITARNRLLPPHGAWGAVAQWGYAAATVLACGTLVARRSGALSSAILGWRAALSAATFIAVAVLPLVMQATQRADGRLDRAQAEVVAIEASGARLLHEGTPYASYDALAALSAKARLEVYVPYQPGMALYGLPRAIFGVTWWTDARIWFAATLVMTVLTAGWLLRLPGDAARDRLLLRAIQFVSVLPICALAITTSGDDLAVVGFSVLAFALAARERFGASGIAIGVAGAIKLLAWPVALVLLALAASRNLKTAARYTIGGIVLPAAVLIPPLLTDSNAVVENVVRLPLGSGLTNSPAASPFPGYLIAEFVPDGHAIAIALLLVAGAAIGIWLARRPPRTAASAAAVSAWGLLAAILLMPATRFGYLLYPIAYAVWAAALSQPRGVDGASLPW
jgi:hypothetical protein